MIPGPSDHTISTNTNTGKGTYAFEGNGQDGP